MNDFMSDSERRAWQSARNLADLGELTAQWLEGRIGQQPGYLDGPAGETLPLVPVLARLNRAGFVTTGSQPASTESPGYDGAIWRQRAAVEGFAGGYVTADIIWAAHEAGLRVIIHPPWALPRWRYRYTRAEVVTTRGGQPHTRSGVQLPRRHIRSGITGYGICHRDAVSALCEAAQVTVIDPEWGRPGLLWDVLGAALADRRPA